MTDDEMKKFRENMKKFIPNGWNIEDAERSTCEYILLRSEDRKYYVTGYGKTKEEALNQAIEKIPFGGRYG